MLIDCELQRIVRQQDPHACNYIYLGEKGGKRSMPILIGRAEADEIHRKFTGQQNPRPFTHDLLRKTLGELGGRIVGVEVDQLVNGTFHAKLLVAADGKAVRIDCRPSDGIALAIAEGVPIAVDDQVLNAVCGES